MPTKYSTTKSSVVLSLLAVLLVSGLISNGFALMPQVVDLPVTEEVRA